MFFRKTILIFLSIISVVCYAHDKDPINQYYDLYDYLETIYEKIEKECEMKQKTLNEIREILEMIDDGILHTQSQKSSTTPP